MLASRAGLAMDPGSIVTYQAVETGRVGSINPITDVGSAKAELKLEVDLKYIKLVPANVAGRPARRCCPRGRSWCRIR
jgi:phospholipid/cholesterol/gamma-HCH transport system substrate-binding protein